ncbi:hypothetical protein BDR22DRAFT_855877 [Usnea florida]
MAEETPLPPPDTADASTPIPPIDNIHSIPDHPPPEPMLPPTHTLHPANLDTEMPEAAPAPPQLTNYAPLPPTPLPATQRTATPTRHVNGTVAAEVAPPMPSKAASHGAPARRYLNEKVTGVLLEGMKRLAADQPENPLQVLGEFLLQRSRDLEGVKQESAA